MSGTPEISHPWSWPEGSYIVLFHWSWADAALERQIHGWSQVSTPDKDGYVHFEAERLAHAITHRIDPTGYPTARQYTFHSSTQLPAELLDSEHHGQPLPWVRALVEARVVQQARQRGE